MISSFSMYLSYTALDTIALAFCISFYYLLYPTYPLTITSCSLERLFCSILFCSVLACGNGIITVFTSPRRPKVVVLGGTSLFTR